MAAARAQHVDFAKERDIMEIIRILREAPPDYTTGLRIRLTERLQPQQRIPIRVVKMPIRRNPDGYVPA